MTIRTTIRITFRTIAIICLLNGFTAHRLAAQTTEKFDTILPAGRSIPLDSVKSLYEQEVLYFKGGFYVKNNTPHRVGFFGKHLKNELRRSTEAAEQIRIGNRKSWVGGTVYTASLAGFIVVASATGSPASLLFLLPAFYGVSKMADGSDHYNKAIWFYNRDALLHHAKKAAR